jgi:hypothetical protein
MGVKFVFRLKENYRLRVYKNRVLRRLLGPKRNEVIGGRRNCTVKRFIIYTLRWILLVW